jgi:Asp-tRNA(Asn)/Glu-tRNA(Gln) amidotransferase C subunit
MDETVRKDIISTLSEVIELLKVKEEADILEIRNISNHTIHNATIFQDEDSISIAILIYALSKVIERSFGKINYMKFLDLLNGARSHLDKKNEDKYRKSIKSVFGEISKIDKRAELYVEEVINQAQIKKGSKLHEHGVSIGRAAEILGISQWELANYVGKTSLTDIETINAIDRVKFVRGLFS